VLLGGAGHFFPSSWQLFLFLARAVPGLHELDSSIEAAYRLQFWIAN
jgi:hypothetical protein